MGRRAAALIRRRRPRSGELATGVVGYRLRDFGDVHVITGVLHLRGKGRQGAFDRRYQFTDTWQRRNGRWQIIAAQDYLIPR